MHLGSDFSHDFFARKDISWRVRKPNAKQNRFQMLTTAKPFSVHAS